MLTSSSGASMSHQLLGRPPVKHDMTTMPLNRRGALEYASGKSAHFMLNFMLRLKPRDFL